jgi:hypothetical protein
MEREDGSTVPVTKKVCFCATIGSFGVDGEIHVMGRIKLFTCYVKNNTTLGHG